MHELDFSLGKSDDAERAAAALAFMMKAQADEWLLKEQAQHFARVSGMWGEMGGNCQNRLGPGGAR